MEENIDILIQKIREARNPKYFLWNLIKDLEWITSKDIVYNYFLIGNKNNINYFSYDSLNYVLYYNYDNIYRILKLKYHLDDLKIKKIVKDVVSEQFNLKIFKAFTGKIKI
jgi:hypothetical protein